MSEVQGEMVEVSGQYTAEQTGLTIKQETTYEQWEEIGNFLMKLHESQPFWIGDWVNWGESKWGEKYTQARALTKLDYSTLAHYKMVCSKIPREQRVEGASFSHHRILVKHDPIQRARLLEQAVEREWTVADLREKSGAASKSVDAKVVCSVCDKDIEGKAIVWRVCVRCDANTKGEGKQSE